ncbi:MAG: hypothetical protein MMC33_003870 [Icmadophila ericetorum]|nr:hypothetical protein [Icmadophila ericetorum]
MSNLTTATLSYSADSSRRFGWVAPPNQRGTINIVWSCFSTLFICLWSMLHLNLPGPTDDFWTIFWRRIRWLLLGILAPELLMLFAFAQWASAKRSVTEMHELGFTRPKWSLVHAFYADSGGFLLDPLDTRAFPITAKQLQYLVRQDFLDIPTISEKEIWDKSKADKFAKTVAILQATWLATQIIIRAVEHLPITPLELFSLALAFTSLSTQWFWLSKPLNVASPTTLTPKTSIAAILIQAGDAAKEPFRTSPLDFVERDIYQSSIWSTTVLSWILCRGLQTRPMQRGLHPIPYKLLKRSSFCVLTTIFFRSSRFT